VERGHHISGGSARGGAVRRRCLTAQSGAPIDLLMYQIDCAIF
jgi:hypothetical protein